MKPRITFHQGRYIRYCHECGKRLANGDRIVLVLRRPRVIKTSMYRTTEPSIPLHYHDLCYEDDAQ